MKRFYDANDAADVNALADEALAIKKAPLADMELGKGRSLGLVFMNPSLRTRLSTERAGRNLGMEVQIINAGTDSWAWELEEDAVMNGNSVEHIKDASGVMGRYFDIIGLRSFPALKSKQDDESEKVFRAFEKYAQKPIVSLESGLFHPLQSLADLMTIRSKGKKKPKVVLTWVPHIKPIPHAVANSFSQWMLKAGMDLTIACPEGMDLDPRFTEGASIYHSQAEALKDADFVYAKNWSSWNDYGKIHQEEAWKLTGEKLGDASFMHCLPMRRGVEIENEVADSGKSLLLEQAENRIYAAQAVLKRMLQELK